MARLDVSFNSRPGIRKILDHPEVPGRQVRSGQFDSSSSE
jgi:hypothetical protein